MTHTAPIELIATTAPALPVPAGLAPVRGRAHHRTGGIVIAVVSALAFSSSGPLVKPLLEAGWSLSAALLVRMGLAGLILSPALVRAITRERSFLRRHWRSLLAFGLIPVAGCQLMFFSAMQRMPVAVALLSSTNGRSVTWISSMKLPMVALPPPVEIDSKPIA